MLEHFQWPLGRALGRPFQWLDPVIYFWEDPTATRPRPASPVAGLEVGLDRHRSVPPPSPGSDTGTERFLPWLC
jgi:hypothetical protein